MAGEGEPKPYDDDATDHEAAEPGDPEAGWPDRHLWQIQPVRDIGVFFAIVGLLSLARIASVVTVPLLLAVLAAYLFEPLVKWLDKRSWMTRRRAVISILLGVVTLVIVPASLGVVVSVAQLNDLRVSVTENCLRVIDSVENPGDDAKLLAVPEGGWRWIRDYVVDMRAEGGGAEIEAAIRWVVDHAEQITTQLVSIGGDTIGAVLGFAGATIGLGFTLFLSGFFFYFVATGWPRVLGFAKSLLPDEHSERIVAMASEMDAAIAGFVRGRLTIAFIQAIVFSTLYAIIGVPAPILLGTAVAILSIVPYLALVGLPVSMLLLFLQDYEGLRGSVWWVLIAPVVVYNIGQALDDYVLTPTIQGKETGLDIPTILFATFAGAAILGLVGMLIAIPLAACVKIVIRDIVWPRYVAWREGRDPDFLPIDRA